MSPTPRALALVTDSKSEHHGLSGVVIACATTASLPVCSVRFSPEELAVWFNYDQVEVVDQPVAVHG